MKRLALLVTLSCLFAFSSSAAESIDFSYTVSMSWKDYKRTEYVFKASAKQANSFDCKSHSRTKQYSVDVPFMQEVTLDRNFWHGIDKCKRTDRSTSYRYPNDEVWIPYTSPESIYHKGELELRVYAKTDPSNSDSWCYVKCGVKAIVIFYDETDSTDQYKMVGMQSASISSEPVRSEVGRIPKPQSQFPNDNEYIPNGLVRNFILKVDTTKPTEVVAWCEETEDEFIVYAFPRALLAKEIPPYASIAMITSSGKKIENISGQPTEVVKAVKYKDDEFQLEHDIIEFVGQAFDVDGDIAEYRWESNQDGVLSNQRTFSYTMLSLGRHLISFQARDDDGLWSTVSVRYIDVIKPPTLLVHGLNSSGDIWSKGDNALAKIGETYPVRSIDITPNNAQISKGANIVSEEIKSLKEECGVPKVNILAHSLGGLNSRWYIENLAYRNDVNKLVMLGTPNHGSTLAVMLRPDKAGAHSVIYETLRNLASMVPYIGGYLKWGIESIAATGTLWGPAVVHMIPGSSALRALNKNKKDEGFSGDESDDDIRTVFGNRVQYFNVYGEGLPTLSHWHFEIPWLGIYIYDFILPTVTLDSDYIVTKQSAKLDDVPSAGMKGKWHSDLVTTGKPIRKALYFLGDDPPEASESDYEMDINSAMAGNVIFASNAEEKLPEISPGTSEYTNFEVDENTSKIHVTMFRKHTSFSPHLGMELISPNGAINYDSPWVEYTESSDSVIVSILNPDPGSWIAEVIADDGVEAASYGLIILGETDFWISLAGHEQIEPGNPLHIRAYVQKLGQPFSGLAVKATVRKSIDEGERIGGKFGSEFIHSEIEEVYLNDLGNGQYEYTYDQTLSTGLYTVLVEVNDPDTNIARSAFTTFFVEHEYDLSVECEGNSTQNCIQFSATSPVHGSMVDIFATVYNQSKIDMKGVEVLFTDGDLQNGGTAIGTEVIDIPAGEMKTSTVSWPASSGEHEIFAIVSPMNSFIEKDTKNNIRSGLISVGDLPPKAEAGPDLTVSYDNAQSGKIFLDGSASEDDVGIVRYAWDLNTDFDSNGDGDSQNDSDLEGISPILSVGQYTKVGDFQVKLTVFDKSGQIDSDTLTIYVRQIFDFVPPVANAGKDLQVAVQDPVLFDGSASTDNLSVASYVWDINVDMDSNRDGIPDNDPDLMGAQPLLSSGYAEFGVYGVKLTVNDGSGNGEASDIITVTVMPGGETYGLMGYTIDSEGSPIPNVAVEINGETYTFSDENGYFLVEALTQGKFRVSAILSGVSFETSPVIVDLTEEMPIKRLDFKESAASTDIPGDIDGDGDVDIIDIQMIRTHLNMPVSSCPKCDTDNDGIISVIDARKLYLLCSCFQCICD